MIAVTSGQIIGKQTTTGERHAHRAMHEAFDVKIVPPTPPYMRFRIRRFRAFSSCDVWQVVFSYPYE